MKIYANKATTRNGNDNNKRPSRRFENYFLLFFSFSVSGCLKSHDFNWIIWTHRLHGSKPYGGMWSWNYSHIRL